MIRKGPILVMFFLGSFFPLFLHSQDAELLLSEAARLEKSFYDEQALKKYLEVVKLQPNNADALAKASELYSLLGKRQTAKDKQKEYYTYGKQYATMALKANPNNSEANFAMAIAMGRMALMFSGEEKVKAVRDVRVYADKCVQLDPKNYKGYHVLGKWNFEVSDLSAFERWIVKVGYGALPRASMDDAAKYYEKSMQLNPSFLLNYLELAKVYKKKDKVDKSRVLLTQMLKMPPTSSDDAKIKRLGKELLDDL